MELDRGCYDAYAARQNLPSWEESHGTLETLAMWRHQPVRLGPVVVSRCTFPRGFYVHHADGSLRSFLQFQDALAFIATQLPGGMDEALSDEWERVEIPRI